MSEAWAIDIGSTNTGVARWDDGAPRMVELPAICREPRSVDPLGWGLMVPSATWVPDTASRWEGRLGGRLVRWLRPEQVHIGRPALEANQTHRQAGFVPGFKAWLGHASLRPLTRSRGKSWAAREIASAFLRTLLAEVRRAEGRRVRDLVVTVPVESYERYRAELSGILRSMGVRSIRFVDEPVAAALGYGLGLSRRQQVLVVDFGGGTLDVAVVEIGPQSLHTGTARVLAKVGWPVGGDQVDHWLLCHLCERLGYRPPEPERSHAEEFWSRLVLGEVRAAKEQLYTRDPVHVALTLPGSLCERPEGSADPFLQLRRSEVMQLLHARGLYELLARCTKQALESARDRCGAEPAIEEVLLVGGSTLLPGVWSLFERRFGRDRLRSWHPFEAVALGACALAADETQHDDFIVHDYAIVTHDAQSGEEQHEIVVPGGTPFPTTRRFWSRHMVPTCAHGLPEHHFQLVVCEIGTTSPQAPRRLRDEEGTLVRLESAASQVVVPLNAASPTLGDLAPPHHPGDRRPRLQVDFMVDDNRWLCATVVDLHSGRCLMDHRSVVRLL